MGCIYKKFEQKGGRGYCTKLKQDCYSPLEYGCKVICDECEYAEDICKKNGCYGFPNDWCISRIKNLKNDRDKTPVSERSSVKAAVALCDTCCYKVRCMKNDSFGKDPDCRTYLAKEYGVATREEKLKKALMLRLESCKSSTLELLGKCVEEESYGAANFNKGRLNGIERAMEIIEQTFGASESDLNGVIDTFESIKEG